MRADDGFDVFPRHISPHEKKADGEVGLFRQSFSGDQYFAITGPPQLKR